MVSRLILNLRGADAAMKTHSRLSGMSSDRSAKRGTIGVCEIPSQEWDTTMLVRFSRVDTGLNKHHRYSRLPRS